jgi:hypothetical protein
MATVANKTENWMPVPKVAPFFGCSAKYLHKCGRAGLFGYRQTGPKTYELLLPEAIDFYTATYPKISIDRKTLDSLMQSTA